MKKLAIVTLALLLGACSSTPSDDVRINGATKETTTSGLKAMYAQSGNKETCELQVAILRIQVGDKNKQVAKTGDKDAMPTSLGPKINGMNYSEIITLSQKYSTNVVGFCRN